MVDVVTGRVVTIAELVVAAADEKLVVAALELSSVEDDELLEVSDSGVDVGVSVDVGVKTSVDIGGAVWELMEMEDAAPPKPRTP